MKKSFSKNVIQQTHQAAKIIEVFENHGFEVESMEQFQEIVADLFSAMSAGGARRGRKPGRPAKSSSAVADDAPKKRGPKPGKRRGRPGRPRKTGKRGRPPKSTVPAPLKKRGRKPGRPVGRPAKKGRRVSKDILEAVKSAAPETQNQD